MSWNLLILLVFTGSVYSEYLGAPSPIKDVKVKGCSERQKFSSDCFLESSARVDFRSYESDSTSFKCEFVRVHDGTSLFQTISRDGKSLFLPGWHADFHCNVEGLKKNETYIVRVFAINEKGRLSPPSPAVIFSFDPNIETSPSMLQKNIPFSPERIDVVYDLKNRVILSWEKDLNRENSNWITSPIEYTIRYGDNKNTSLWNELTTNNTWIILDDLVNGTVYSAYLVAKENSLRSCNSYTFPIVIGEDMTGLPEPILTIEPADKNGVFGLGDPMTVKCAIPPNIYAFIISVLTVGQRFDVGYVISHGQIRQPAINTTAIKDVYTAKCSAVEVGQDISRHSYVSWKVEETLENEQLRKTAIDPSETSVNSNACPLYEKVNWEYFEVPNAIKNLKVSSDCSSDFSAHVEFDHYESNTISYKCEFVGVYDGTSSIVTVESCSIDPLFEVPNKISTYFCHVGNLKANESYIVRVFAINGKGQSPPSPALIFSLDPTIGTRRPIPHVPEKIHVAYSLENRVNVTWEEVRRRENYDEVKNPVEYIIRYGDNKNMSLWNELTTNNTWITLDNLMNGTVYSAYLVAKENNLRSRNSYTFPIVIGEDMTGLPEPMLTIEPADKNGVFSSGDPIRIKCTIPSNTYPFAATALRVGKHLETAMFAYKNSLTIDGTANADVYTAKCSVFFGPDSRISRHSYGNWTVKKTLNDEHLQKPIICANEKSINLNLVQEETLPHRLEECKRLCYFDPEQVEENFPFHNLKSHYCSDIVLHYFHIESNDVNVTDKARNLLEEIENWRKSIIPVSPKLILSMGAKQSNRLWQSITGNELVRKKVAKKLIAALLLTAADGIELSWSKEPLVNKFDKENLKALMDDIKKADRNKYFEITVAATPENSYNDLYDYEHLKKTASLVILHSPRLHSNFFPYIGHHSLLRSTPSMKNPNMSWQSLLRHWVHVKKFPRSKIVLSLTASQWADNSDMPLRRHDQKFAYDNFISSHVTSVWASIEGLGLGLHDIHHDDPNGNCKNKTSFPLLKALSRAQVCQFCLEPHDINKCDEDDFVVSCHFELKKNTPHFELSRIFNSNCTEIVVKQAQLVLGGEVTFKDAQQEQVLKNLTNFRPKMWKSGLVMSLSCGDSEEQLNHILGKDNMTSAIENVLKMMEKYEFSGVHLDCEKAVGRRNNVNFNTFVGKLSEKFQNTKASNGCNRTLSIGFSSFTKSPSDFYNITLFSQLFYVSLRMSETENRIDLPFFQNHSDPTYPSTEEFVKLWKVAGLKTNRLILELSPYGWQEKKRTGEKKIINQGELCRAITNHATVRHDYFSLTGSTPHSNGTLHFPMIEDIRYKLAYIQREKLGGIAFNSMNGDDYMGFCGRGPFPIIHSIYNLDKCKFW